MLLLECKSTSDALQQVSLIYTATENKDADYSSSNHVFNTLNCLEDISHNTLNCTDDYRLDLQLMVYYHVGQTLVVKHSFRSLVFNKRHIKTYNGFIAS